MRPLTRSLFRSARLPPRSPAASAGVFRQYSHIQHPNHAATPDEWLIYFEQRDAQFERTEREVIELREKLSRMETAQAQSEAQLENLRAQLLKRKTDYNLLTAAELVVEAAYRNGTITTSADNTPQVIVCALTELKKDPLLTSLAGEEGGLDGRTPDEQRLRFDALNMSDEAGWYIDKSCVRAFTIEPIPVDTHG
ncbi:hypothetical protein DACRYDRAFT_113935 [Dacryopinax primogenitus]|uniref:Uncharacterized protein n=1 Tax=Dacryopinax primogenitus (strain DJM 731) TaxID=1858805 RepID=M5G733_DACPD|nr:uncharacterized protein DACRYDRAFT_113935 [Dacryopinax primogenitus]EJU04534.1 hypothetical protein DACRYDRAFT_113935 [Dacryopinax primogenitus]